MTDFEDRLREYRPQGPPAELRARFVREADRTASNSLRDWLPALGTAALIVVLYVIAAGIRISVYEQIAGPAVQQNVEAPLP